VFIVAYDYYVVNRYMVLFDRFGLDGYDPMGRFFRLKQCVIAGETGGLMRVFTALQKDHICLLRPKVFFKLSRYVRDTSV